MRRHGLRASLAALAVAAFAFTGVATAGVAAASPPPGTPLVQANTNGWSGMSYRPGHIYVGMGGSPYVHRLSWGSWTAWSAATSSGRLTRYWPKWGVPSYLWPYTTRPVKVYLHDVRTHNGQKYFAKMRWNWTNKNGKARVAYWLFAIGGGTAPGWQPRT